VLQPEDTGGLSLSESTLADVLRGAGYATMCIGKWHLGSQPQYMPARHGFDQLYGLPYSDDMSPLPLMQNTAVIEEPAKLDTLTQRYTEQAVSFMARSKDRPFLLYMAHTFPHIPLVASRRFPDKSGFGLYGDAVAEVDWSVGEVVRAIGENGLTERTLVMFSSDHGPWFEGSAGRLRGRKAETWEGGVRVPFLARFPGQIPAGRVCASLATTMDIVPTVVRLCGAILPAAPLDGYDIWSLLTAQQDTANRETFLYLDSWSLQCARLGPWKLHLARYNTPSWIPLPPRWRQNLPLANPELYNLETDLEESYDAANENPQIVASIRASIERLLATFPEPVPTLWRNAVLAPGVYCPSGGWPSAP
jgi:arylsulfatase A